MTELPRFRFHPDPIATGAVVASDKVCASCELRRGFMCSEPPFTAQQLGEDEAVCPWCVADGSAAKKLDCSFVSQCEEFGSPGACWPDKDTIEELFQRTPGFESWQGAFWLCHCGDVCEFRGEVSAERLAAIPEDVFEASVRANPLLEAWRGERTNYRKAPDIAVYEFKCRQCEATLLGADAS